MSGSPPPFTNQEIQAAAAAYIAGGSAPSWWGSMLADKGSMAAPTSQTLMGQQAVRNAAAADQAWIAGLPQTPTTQQAGSWIVATNADGRQVYVNTGTGQTSTAPPPAQGNQAYTPSIGDVSQYLQSLFVQGSTGPSAQQLAAQAAGSADAAWIRGLNEYSLGAGAQGSAWVAEKDSKGSTIYVNKVTGEVSQTDPTIGSYYAGSVPNGTTRPYTSTQAPTRSGSGSAYGRSLLYFDGDKSINTKITKDEATDTRTSDDLNAITYSSSINDEQKAAGPIVTLLDLTNRDIQDNDMFPLRTEITWFTRDQGRRTLPFSPVVQETALRGPAAFGQRFTFDLGSIMVGDLLLGTALQIRLDHWLDPQTQNVYAAGKLMYQDRAAAWEYANSLGTSIIQLAELEVDGKTLETIDGDFIQTFSALFPDYNAQFGVAYDHLGQIPKARLLDPARAPNLFPVENGNLNCILPFFFMRTRLREAIPMIAIREGYVKIHITLRPFDQCVRQMRGTRSSCDSVPPPTPVTFTFPNCSWIYTAGVNNGAWDIQPAYSFSQIIGTVSYNWTYSQTTHRGSWNTPLPASITVASEYHWTAATQAWTPDPPPFNLTNGVYTWHADTSTWSMSIRYTGPPTYDFSYGNNVWTSKVGDWSVAAPAFKSVQLLTYGAIVDGAYRSKMLREPFEILHRQVQTFYFDEPLKYSIGKRQDAIRIQLPLEANHPIEEIIWFVRRKGTSANNEWTNFTGVLESEWNARAAAKPMLQNAIVQANGTVLCDADEQFYREGISSAHRGGFAAYSRFIYGYSFAKAPGEHQPSGSLNASRLNALRLVLDVMPPGGVLDASWEVKVFCIGLNWLRFENGLANPMFED